jgi:hypothetical protein
MKHFSINEGWIDDMKRAALYKARDAWRNWSVLTKYFVRRGREPFKKYTSITKKYLETLKNMKKTKDFKELSKNKRIW